ncbi:hypothetical protein XPU_0284, partial [Xanthomonas arboricola pv. pruni str. MAFF 311562]
MRASPWCFCWAWPARGDAIRRTGEARARICLAAQRGSTISGKLLSFSRRDLAVPTHFDAAQAVQAIAPMLAYLLGAHVRLQVDTCAAPVPVCPGPQPVR